MSPSFQVPPIFPFIVLFRVTKPKGDGFVLFLVAFLLGSHHLVPFLFNSHWKLNLSPIWFPLNSQLHLDVHHFPSRFPWILPQVLCLLEHVDTHPPTPCYVCPLPCKPSLDGFSMTFILFLAPLILQYLSCSSHLCLLPSS